MSVEPNPHNYTNMNLIFSQFAAAKNPVRPRKNTAEGGWGEFRRVLAKNRGQPRRLACQSNAPQKNTLFIKRGKNRSRAKRKKQRVFFCGAASVSERRRGACPPLEELHSSGVSRKCVRISFRVWRVTDSCQPTCPCPPHCRASLFLKYFAVF